MVNVKVTNSAIKIDDAVKNFAAMDDARFGFKEFRMCLVAGCGFFTDAYDLFVISLALPMIYQVWFPDQPNFAALNPNTDALMKASTNWGNFIGQLVFGYLGDKVGRKAMYGVELVIIIVCTIGSACSASSMLGPNVLVYLCFWRLFLGIGIGGDYPLSSIITSEFANVKNRGAMMSGVFALQGIGILVGGLVTLGSLTAFEPLIRHDPANLDYVWRIMLMFGVLPCAAAIYFRLTIPESPRYLEERRIQSERASLSNVEEGAARGSLADFRAHFGQWRHFKVLLGTTYTWFALDIAFYGLSLNQSSILSAMNYNGSNTMSLYDQYYQRTLGIIIINVIGTVPGYWLTVLLIDKWGRKPIQYIGFAVITASLIILAVFWVELHSSAVAFVAIYSISQFFFNFGPNSITFVLAGEVFPTRWRSTGHGISAACGKIGAIIGIQVVGPHFIANAKGVLYTFSAVMASGFLATSLIPETMGKSLEQMADEKPVERVPVMTQM